MKKLYIRIIEITADLILNKSGSLTIKKLVKSVVFADLSPSSDSGFASAKGCFRDARTQKASDKGLRCILLHKVY